MEILSVVVEVSSKLFGIAVYKYYILIVDTFSVNFLNLKTKY